MILYKLWYIDIINLLSIEQNLVQGGRSVIKSNMAAFAVYYTIKLCMVTSNMMIAIHIFVFKMHTFKILQKLNHILI